MIVDLRSDTVTKPSTAMREAMARAEVGDDVYGEDPSVNQLQERVAALLGKEAALYVPSGTMANQIALAIHTRPGDEVLVSHGAHCMVFESGAAGALAGVQFGVIGDKRGRFTAADVAEAINPDNHHFAPTTLVAVENTHNRGGGAIVAQRDILAIADLVHRRGLALHLDGARIWNAHVATGMPLHELAAPFDTVSVCLSKGLGAPVGSLMAGTKALVHKAHRRRKMLGGGMRQAGLLAAAGLWALEHNLARLAEDHANARRFAEPLARLPGIGLDLATVETNIVIWDLLPDCPLDGAAFVARARAQGLLLNAVAARRLRAVTHLDVDANACAAAAEIAAAVLRAA
ncbi:MAG: Low-specificity L-threonine aldolase [Myxococcales bacterium]|nr:Low-specificity L-threonine aldolase [Myxococcales bacterium]